MAGGSLYKSITCLSFFFSVNHKSLLYVQDRDHERIIRKWSHSSAENNAVIYYILFELDTVTQLTEEKCS